MGVCLCNSCEWVCTNAWFKSTRTTTTGYQLLISVVLLPSPDILNVGLVARAHLGFYDGTLVAHITQRFFFFKGGYLKEVGHT